MLLLEVKDATKTVEIIGTTSTLVASNSLVALLLASLDSLYAGVPSSSLVFELVSGTMYKFKYTAVDGRIWTQDLDVPAGSAEPSMNFNAPQLWKISILIRHQPVRNACIDLARLFGSTKIEVVWP